MDLLRIVGLQNSDLKTPQMAFEWPSQSVFNGRRLRFEPGKALDA